MPETLVFLDTRALFAAVLSASGGARALLKLGEVGDLPFTVGTPGDCLVWLRQRLAGGGQTPDPAQRSE